MWKATIAGLRAHRVRLGLTALSIVLGVSFVAATFIFTDTLKRTFDSLFGGVYGKISVQVREPSPVNDQFGNRSYIPMPESILARVSGLPGVAASEGTVQDSAQLVDKHGKAITTNGAPTIGSDYGPLRTLSGFSLSQGHAPVGPEQVVIDKGTADHYHFRVGDPIQILFQGPPERFTIVGIIRFGNSAGLGGATVAQFDLPTAQRLLNRVGTYDAVNLLAKPGVSTGALQAQVEQVLPQGYEAVTGAQLAKQNADQVNKGLSFFTDFLLVFALISLFVGSFIILNTFSILVAQRTREYALLRAVGASRRQILVGTLAEAGVVGLIASALGVAAGAGLAVGLRAIFKASGASFPSYGLVVNARTIIVGLAVGTGVSLLASLNPARRASRISPVAALGDAVVESAGAPVRRAVLGLSLLAVGLVMMFTGLFVSQHNQGLEVGIGIAVTFLGVATLAPFIARGAAAALGRPLVRTSGIAGVLARQNAMRNPRRTAATASALMIGLALVTMFSVFGQSAKASLDKSVNQNFLGDYVIKTSGANFNTFSPTVEPLVAAVPGVAVQSPERQGLARYGTSTVTLTGVDPATIAQVIKVPMTGGQLSSLGHGDLLVDKDAAHSKGWTVGSRVALDFAKSGLQTFTIGGTFKSNQLLGSNYLVSTATFDANFDDVFDYVIALKTAPAANRVAASAAIARAISGYPSLAVENPTTVEKDQAGQINQLLTIIDALLALAIIIAVIGIINTLVLSVLERTRELGLLRAVGMSRRQVRRMVRGESVVIALFGAVLGMIVGVGFGAALSRAVLKGSSGVLSIPVPTLIVFLILATAFGVVAAIWPARRAARTNLLSALAFE